LFRTSKSKISDFAFTLENEIPHPAPEAKMAFVSQMKANVDVEQTRRIKGALKVHSVCTRPSPLRLRGLLQRLVSFSSPSGALQGAQLLFPDLPDSISV